jgi:hypothetical protein
MAALVYFVVAEKHAYYHAGYVTSAYVGVDILEDFAEPFTPRFTLPDPVVNPVSGHGPLFIITDEMVNSLDKVLGILIRIVAQ